MPGLAGVFDLSGIAFFAKLAGAGGLILLFFILHLLSGLFARPRPPALWLLAERACEELVRRLNKPRCSPRELRLRAAFLVLMLAVSGMLIGLAVERLAAYPFGWLAQLVLLFTCVSVMGQVRLLRSAAQAEAPIDRAAVSSLLRPIVRDSFDHADAYTLSRRTLETAAVALNLFFVMPVLWFLLGGAVAMMIVVMLSALAVAAEGMAEGVPDQPFVGFVRDVVGWLEIIPAWLTALLIAVGAVFVSTAHPLTSITTAVTQARGFRPRRQGAPVAAMAGALGVTLGGPRRHENGHTVVHGWVGAGGTSARAGRGDIQRAALLHFVVFILFFLALTLGVGVAGQSLFLK